VIEQNPHALAIIAALEADALTVGDGDGAETAGTVTAPQIIVLLIPGGRIDGSIADPDEWADARFQLTAVGRVAAEARWYADKAATALETNAVTVAGRSVMRVRPTQPWGPVTKDLDVTPPLFYSTRTYGLFTFPT
jgi:hypothetical protein